MVNFNGWFELAHRTRTADGRGGWTESYTVYATERGRMSLLGRIGMGGDKERLTGSQLEEWHRYLLFVRQGAAIERGDRVTETKSGRVFEALGIRVPSAGRHLEVECREIEL